MIYYEGEIILWWSQKYNSKTDQWEEIKIALWETESVEVKSKNKIKNLCMIDYYIIFKRFKYLSHVFVICIVINVDQFLMILAFYWSIIIWIGLITLDGRIHQITSIKHIDTP